MTKFSFLLACGLSLSSCAGSRGGGTGPAECPDYNPGTHFCDTRDGKVYRYAIIGDQVWMAENLNYKLVKKIPFSVEVSSCIDSDCDKGRLYSWNAIVNVCPSGWYVPSNAEWQKLIDFAGGRGTAGKHLKAKNGWSDGGNGLDTYGFAALPASGIFIKDDAGNFISRSSEDNVQAGYWWSASGTYILFDPNTGAGVTRQPDGSYKKVAQDQYLAPVMSMRQNDDGVLTAKVHQDNKFAIRCVADAAMFNKMQEQQSFQQQALNIGESGKDSLEKDPLALEREKLALEKEKLQKGGAKKVNLSKEAKARSRNGILAGLRIPHLDDGDSTGNSIGFELGWVSEFRLSRRWSIVGEANVIYRNFSSWEEGSSYFVHDVKLFDLNEMLLGSSFMLKVMPFGGPIFYLQTGIRMEFPLYGKIKYNGSEKEDIKKYRNNYDFSIDLVPFGWHIGNHFAIDFRFAYGFNHYFKESGGYLMQFGPALIYMF